MKRSIIAAMLAFALLFNSCIGSFTLTDKLYSWNREATDNRYLNSAIMWVLAILPVYGATLFIDAAVLNVIEFWGGENPMAFTEPEIKKKTVQIDGKAYEVSMGDKKISITHLEGVNAGDQISLLFDEKTKAFYLSDSSSDSVKVGAIYADMLDLYSPDGTVTSRPLEVEQVAQTN